MKKTNGSLRAFKKDIWVIAITLTVAIIIYTAGAMTASSDGMVRIMKADMPFGEYPLDKDAKIDIDGKNMLIIEHGTAYMSYADCPDRLCIEQGRISDSSGIIICLPNKVVVTVDKKSEIDAVAR